MTTYQEIEESLKTKIDLSEKLESNKAVIHAQKLDFLNGEKFNNLWESIETLKKRNEIIQGLRELNYKDIKAICLFMCDVLKIKPTKPIELIIPFEYYYRWNGKEEKRETPQDNTFKISTAGLFYKPSWRRTYKRITNDRDFASAIGVEKNYDSFLKCLLNLIEDNTEKHRVKMVMDWIQKICRHHEISENKEDMEDESINLNGEYRDVVFMGTYMRDYKTTMERISIQKLSLNMLSQIPVLRVYYLDNDNEDRMIDIHLINPISELNYEDLFVLEVYHKEIIELANRLILGINKKSEENKQNIKDVDEILEPYRVLGEI